MLQKLLPLLRWFDVWFLWILELWHYIDVINSSINLGRTSSKTSVWLLVYYLSFTLTFKASQVDSYKTRRLFSLLLKTTHYCVFVVTRWPAAVLQCSTFRLKRALNAVEVSRRLQPQLSLGLFHVIESQAFQHLSLHPKAGFRQPCFFPLLRVMCVKCVCTACN